MDQYETKIILALIGLLGVVAVGVKIEMMLKRYVSVLLKQKG